MQKHFQLTITEKSFSFQRNNQKIKDEALLDGLYVVRTSVKSDTMPAVRVVETYKSLSRVERAFRCLKNVDLQLRPIYHHKDERIRAHVFLCMLAYYVEWHMRERLREVLFDDCDTASASASRTSVVGPSVRSAAAKRKDATRRTPSGHPVQSFQDRQTHRPDSVPATRLQLAGSGSVTRPSISCSQNSRISTPR